jgi:hypothetical protein
MLRRNSKLTSYILLHIKLLTDHGATFAHNINWETAMKTLTLKKRIVNDLYIRVATIIIRPNKPTIKY